MEIDVSAPAVLQHPTGSFVPSHDQPPLVLVVDDDPAIRLLCAVNLRLQGLIVLEASDGPSALAQARSNLPDLVVTDITMPGLDGFQLAEELQRDERTAGAGDLPERRDEGGQRGSRTRPRSARLRDKAVRPERARFARGRRARPNRRAGERPTRSVLNAVRMTACALS